MRFAPRMVVEDIPPMCGIQSLFADDLFLCFLFIQNSEVPAVNKPRRACSYFSTRFFVEPGQLFLVRAPLFFLKSWEITKFIRAYKIPFKGFTNNSYAFISTSTPEGRSNLLRASTVLEEEV